MNIEEKIQTFGEIPLHRITTECGLDVPPRTRDELSVLAADVEKEIGKIFPECPCCKKNPKPWTGGKSAQCIRVAGDLPEELCQKMISHVRKMAATFKTLPNWHWEIKPELGTIDSEGIDAVIPKYSLFVRFFLD